MVVDDLALNLDAAKMKLEAFGLLDVSHFFTSGKDAIK
jgi:hypothetical protein